MGVRRQQGRTAKFPFPILGIDSDNGYGFISRGLFRWCEQENLTFTRSRPGTARGRVALQAVKQN